MKTMIDEWYIGCVAVQVFASDGHFYRPPRVNMPITANVAAAAVIQPNAAMPQPLTCSPMISRLLEIKTMTANSGGAMKP